MSETSLSDFDPEQLRELLSITEEREARGDGEEAASSCRSRSSFMPPQQLGSWIDRYKLIEHLGEGGMAIVYLAEQEYPVHRKVALKLIKPGMDSKKVIARFEMERQTLTLLNHANIAQIYDAGTTESGLPYFVMEYVKGLPITEYCDHHKRTVEERLSVFLQVCQAIQHAHQKGIIHRDIKPSNILVSLQDDQAVPKVIDFGVAKAIAQPLTERTLYTEQGQLFGTPEYMSPEQADMANEDIDTRSDVYSLGVLLYVLLTGVLPFDAATFREGGIEHIRKVIRETDPKTPSTRLTSLGDEAKEVAQKRRTEVGTLAKRLHRELEWIPLKAMRKDRTRRYRSASELADDIQHYLQGAPLIAGPESTVYRVKKFVRRNRALVAGVTAVLIVLTAGVVVSTILAITAERARAEAQAVSDFLQNSVLSSLNLRDVKGKEITVRSILDAISKDLDVEFQGQPLFEASIRQTLASAYGVLGLYRPAELHAKRTFEIRRTQLGTKNIATLYSRYQIGWVYMLQGRYSEAEPLLTEGLERFKLTWDEDHPVRLYCIAFLGWVYNFQGRFPEAEELLKGGLDAAQRARVTEDSQAPYLMYSLAFAHRMQGRYQEAERLYLRGLEISHSVPGEQHDDTLFLMQGLGALLWDLGRYDEAEEFLQAALKGRRQVWGEEHQDTLWVMAELGWLYHSQGRYKEAEELLYPTLETARQVLGEAHLLSMHAMHGLSTLYLSQGRYDEAEPLLEKTLENGRSVMGEENWLTLKVKSTLAQLYRMQDRQAMAEALYLKTLEAQHRVLSNDHPNTLTTVNGLALLRKQQGRFEDANDLFHEALRGRQSRLGNDHPATLETKNDLGVMYREQSDYDKAEPLILEAVKGRRLKLGDTHPHTLQSLNNLIDLYDAWSKPDKAEQWRAKRPID